VNLPAGVEDGQTLRLRILGEQEAVVQIKVEGVCGLRRVGNNVHSDIVVSIADAALGNIVSVRGLHKDVLKVKLPPKLSSHSVLVLKNQGFSIPKSPGQFGSHYLHVRIRSLQLEEQSNKKNASSVQ